MPSIAWAMHSVMTSASVILRRPFRWTATTEQILEKVRRGRVTLDAIAS
jgi:hypothetical protein